MDELKLARGSACELILTVCAALRRVVPSSPEDVAYNNALGDVFDYIIENESSCLMPGTIRNGKWVRDEQRTKE